MKNLNKKSKTLFDPNPLYITQKATSFLKNFQLFNFSTLTKKILAVANSILLNKKDYNKKPASFLGFKQKIIALLLIFISIPVMAQSMEKSVAESLAWFYSNYSDSHRCYFNEDIYNNDNPFWCMRYDASEVVSTPTGKYIYLLLRGVMLIESENKNRENYPIIINSKNNKKNYEKYYASHGESGVVAMFVFKQNGSGWQLSYANKHIEVPSSGWGSTPENWILQQFGKNIYGFTNKSVDGGQGVFDGVHSILLPNIAKSISVYTVSSEANYVGAGFDANLTSTLKPRKDLSSNGGIYPLELMITGYLGTKKYSNTKCIVRFNSQENNYILPKNCPLHYDNTGKVFRERHP